MARQRKKGDANAEQQQPANGSGWNPLNLLMNGLIIMFPSQIAINRGPWPPFSDPFVPCKKVGEKLRPSAPGSAVESLGSAGDWPRW